MLDILQRPRPVAVAASVPVALATSGGREAAPRDWAVPAPQHVLVPRPRVSADGAARSRVSRPTRRTPSRTGRRDWVVTPVMEPLAPALPTARPGSKRVKATTAAAADGERLSRAPLRFVRLAAVLALNAVLLSAVVGFVGLALGPRTGQYQTLTMLTGSMRPQFPAGSVVVVTREPVDALRPGHVITYHAPIEDRRVVTHRVVSIDRSGAKPVVVTKGDANAGNDPWQAALNDDHVWRARFAVPLLGDAIRLLRQPAAQTIATRALPGLLLVWLLASIWRGGDSDAET